MLELTSAINDKNHSLADALGRGDAAGMASLYTADGSLFPPGADRVTGHDGIEAFWSAVMDMGIASAHLETTEIDDQGDTVIEAGRYLLGAADGTVADEGKYLVVWKNEDGVWKLHRDIWNTSRN